MSSADSERGSEHGFEHRGADAARGLFEERARSGAWLGLYDGEPSLRSHPFHARLAAVESLLDRRGEPGRVLDVGAGGGEFAAAVRARGGSWVGLDTSRAMLELARARDPNTGTRLLQASAEEPPFSPGSFDTLLVLGLLGFLPEPRHTLLVLSRLLRGDGAMIVQAGKPDLWSRLRRRQGNPDAIEHPLEAADLDRMLAEIGLRSERRIWIDFLPAPRRVRARLPELSMRLSNAMQYAGGLFRPLARSHVTLVRRAPPSEPPRR